jgi:hypothetical protein
MKLAMYGQLNSDVDEEVAGEGNSGSGDSVRKLIKP